MTCSEFRRRRRATGALAAEVLTLLSDPTRIRLILALEAAKEMSVGELAATVDRAPSSVSQHLARQRKARMVITRHEGTRVRAPAR